MRCLEEIMTRRRVILIAATLFLSSNLLPAQQPDMQLLAAGMAKNQEALKQYLWQSRVTVEVDGEQKKVELSQMRYDMDGQLQKTSLGGESDQKKVRGPVRKNIAKKKKKQASEFAEQVKHQLHAYMTPQALMDALSNAFARKEDGKLMLRAENVVAEGDSLDCEIVEATKQMMSMRISTAVEGSPLNVEVIFQKLDDGPTYPARQIINTSFEKKKLVITTENYDYVKQP
jgi:hypothetical protein